MGMTTTLPATISLAAIGDTESGTGVIIGNSGTTTINYDDTVISVEMRFGQSSAPCPNGYTLIEFGANLSVDDITVTAVGNGSTTLEFVSGKPAVTPTVSIPVTVGAVAEDESYLNKRGLTHFWENIDDIKQNKLTAGAGILITNDVISATGGGTADAVDWGHITGSMSNQTDLTTALAAKANSADLAAVATSGDYDDLTDKPTIGNATLTIQKNGTSAGTFTANATSNKTINITVPTTAADVSALPASTKYGASITVTIDPSDYKVTTTLKDQDGNRLGAAQTIDLPLESMVVNGSYDSTNKKIVLTLQSGSTIDIPVADLVAGLQSEITSTNKLASDLVDDTNQTHKFMTSAEKTKLSGIATGAEVNVQSDWNVTSTSSDAFIKNKPTIPTKTSDLTNDSGFLTSYTETDPVFSASPAADITAADISSWDAKSDFSGSYNDLTDKPTIPTVGNATLTIQKNGTNVQTFTANATSNKTANITVPTKTSDLTNDSDFVEDASYVHTDNNYTTAEKNKLAGIATGAEVNVQSDWSVTDSSSDAFIKNKPTIPTVNNATLTIQKNGTNVQTFTANSSSNKTANITVPTTVAELSDASTYVTQNSLATQLANKQNTLTAGDHINIAGNTIKAVDYVHSDDPVSTTAVTPVVTNNMIADGTITADKLATGATVKLTLSTSDIGEGAALAANTLYGVYI